MSIYASYAAPDDTFHEDGCAIYIEDPAGSGCFEWSGEGCDCGLPQAPLVYAGSHVLPSVEDPRGGRVSLAEIPGHITRDGRDDGPEDDGTPWPYLRFGVNGETVVLDRQGVETVHRSLSSWLDALGS